VIPHINSRRKLHMTILCPKLSFKDEVSKLKEKFRFFFNSENHLNYLNESLHMFQEHESHNYILYDPKYY